MQHTDATAADRGEKKAQEQTYQEVLINFK